MLVLQAGSEQRVVHLPAGCQVWKETQTTPDAIALGDWVDVRGDPQPDGSLLARSGWIWVNIGRREGEIVALGPASLTIRHNKGIETIELSQSLQVIDSTTGTQRLEGIAVLRPGMHIGMVGLLLPDGRFRATRIWGALNE